MFSWAAHPSIAFLGWHRGNPAVSIRGVWTVMASRVQAFVKPELLKWARETGRFSIESAAEKVGVKTDRLAGWERGDNRPTMTQLRKLADVYKRPLAAFFLSVPPKPEEPIRDFRKFPGEGGPRASPTLLREVRRMTYRRQIALDLFTELNEIPPELGESATLEEDPERLGDRVRSLLGVTYEAQMGWKGEYDPFNHWRARMENLGILVFQATEVPLEEMLGFSISKWPLPVIVVNIKHHPRARVFTMLHEFIHLLLREGGICDLEEDDGRPIASQNVEVYCNRAAGAALVPLAHLLEEQIVKEAGRGAVFSDEQIMALAQRYGVSREVIVRRLLIAGRVTEQFYREKRDTYQREFGERRDTRSGGFARPYQLAISSTGRLFTRLVLESYDEERITASDLADYLGVRLKHLPRIQSAMRSGRFEDLAAL